MPPRWLFVMAAGAACCGSVAPARAGFISAPDVVLYCDPDIAHACSAAGAEYRARSGVPVRVLTAPGPQLLALLQRGTRNDVIITLSFELDASAAQHLIAPDHRFGHWQDALVVGGRDAPPATDAADLARRLAVGKLALVDPTEAGSLDGPALARRLGWRPAATMGALDGTEIAWMLAHFAANLGVLPLSALRAEPSLAVVATVPPDAYPAITYSAAVSHNALSRYAVGFLDFLKTPAAEHALAGAGLEQTQ